MRVISSTIHYRPLLALLQVELEGITRPFYMISFKLSKADSTVLLTIFA